MDDKKDIGKLIKERLANTEVAPNNLLWASIEKTLDEKQRRRGGLLWLGSGILLLLIIIPALYVTYNNESQAMKNSVLETPVLTSEPTLSEDKIPMSLNQNNEQINKSPSEIIIDTNNPDTKNSPNSISANYQKRIQEKLKNQNTYTNETEFASVNNKKPKVKKETLNERGTPRKSGNTFDEEKKLASSNTPMKRASEKLPLNHSKEKSISKEDSAPTDSLKNIDDFSKEKKKVKDVEEPKKKKENSKLKWQISIQATPTVLGYFSKGNPFDKSLNNGQLRSDLSYSYGAFLNIPLSEKLTFRFGFRNTNLKYYVEQATTGLSNNGTPDILTSNSINRNNTILSNDFIQSLSSSNTFRIDQKINYHEIPFQFLYRIRNKKIKIDAILGLSGMLLNKSSIALKSNTANLEIGSAAYLKQFTLSSSVGLGFRYELSEKIRFDLEPTFLYHHSSFETNFENLRLFILSVQAGTTIKL